LNNNLIVVMFNDDKVQTVFDLTNEKDFLFFSELIMIDSISRSMQLNQFRELIADSNPDLFSFSFSSLKGLKSDSQKFVAALLILDSVISQLISNYQSLYDGRIAVEVAFMGVTAYQLAHDSNTHAALKQDVYNKLSNYITDKQLFDDSFPVIYVGEEDADVSCKLLSQLNDESLHLTCPVMSLPHLSVRDSSSVGYVEVSRDVAIFQIVLWFSIILVLTLLAAIYALFGMDVGHQTNQFMLPAKSK